MTLTNVYFDAAGFDPRMIKGGPSHFVWNLAHSIAANREDSALLIPSHGELELFIQDWGFENIWEMTVPTLELPLEPDIWPTPSNLCISGILTLWKGTIQGVEVFVIDHYLLRAYRDSYFPPYETKGKDLGFFKPLVFQILCLHVLLNSGYFSTIEPIIFHEPYYHFLMIHILALKGYENLFSVIHSNMPLEKRFYFPTLQPVGRIFGLELDCDYPQRTNNPAISFMESILPSTHLHYPQGEGIFIPIMLWPLRDSLRILFLNEGHRQFVIHQSHTPMENLISKLPLHTDLKKIEITSGILGACLNALWLEGNIPKRNNERSTKFFHSGRWAPGHKGQFELLEAVQRFVRDNTDSDSSFILHFLGLDEKTKSLLNEQINNSPRVVILNQTLDQKALKQFYQECDFCIFPSKFEMETFFMSIGEAMTQGCIPISTIQIGTQHWWSTLPDSILGLWLTRSFQEHSTQLVDEIIQSIKAASDFHHNNFRELEKIRDTVAEKAKEIGGRNIAQRLIAYIKGHDPGIFSTMSKECLPKVISYEQLKKSIDVKTDSLEISKTGIVEVYWNRFSEGYWQKNIPEKVEVVGSLHRISLSSVPDDRTYLYIQGLGGTTFWGEYKEDGKIVEL